MLNKIPSFNHAVFRDPETGCFRWPKYASEPDALVKIRDRTPYATELWKGMGYSQREKCQYSLEMATTDLECILFDITLDRPAAMLKPRNKDKLGDLAVFIGKSELVESIVGAVEHGDNSEQTLHAVPKALLENGALELVEDLLTLYQHCPTDALKVAAKAAGINISQKRADLIDAIIAANVKVKLPKVVRVGSNARALLGVLADLYCADIEHSIRTWHPYVRCAVWQTVLEETPWNAIGLRAKYAIAELSCCP